MTDIPTAEQTRKTMNLYKKNMVENELKKVKEEIQKAVEKGDAFCYHERSLSEDTKQILKNLGYKIQTNSEMCDGTWTEIIWEDKNET